MARAIDGTITATGEATRRFRTTDVTVRDLSIGTDNGSEERFRTIGAQLPVANALSEGARGRFYLSSGLWMKPYVYGADVEGRPRVFDGNNAFDTWMVVIFYLVLGVAFFWTGIGLVVAWLGLQQFRLLRDAKAARALFDADAVSRAHPPAARGV